MREFPVFIPHAQDHMAGVVTVPDGEVQALVLLLTGTGAPRSHRFQIWTRAARRLAEHGIASMRIDYMGIGDSTGMWDEVPLEDVALDEMLSVVRFGIRAVGTQRIGVVGNCSGANAALHLAAELSECEAALCFLPRILDPSGVNKMVIGARGLKLTSLLRTNKTLLRLARPIRGRKGRMPPAIRRAFAGALSKGRLMFVYTEQDTDSYSRETVRQIDLMLKHLRESDRRRFEMVVLSNGPMSGFESVDIQQQVIDMVVKWSTTQFVSNGLGELGSTKQAAVT